MADLYWNEQGAINCDKHIPMKDSDTWKSERWQKISVNDRLAIAAEQPTFTLQCEICK